ncbi:MAG: hypothetical protein HOW73_11300 [Polyangiaceae bacterium]|nr:hypothetical protein [Polyangiaceae bacterium]
MRNVAGLLTMLAIGCTSAGPSTTEIVYLAPTESSAVATEPIERRPPRPPATSGYPRATPEQTIASFLRAHADGRFDVLMQFVPKEERSGDDPITEDKLREAWQGSMRADLESRLGSMRDALDRGTPIEHASDRLASMVYGQGLVVTFVRQEDGWTIKDF